MILITASNGLENDWPAKLAELHAASFEKRWDADVFDHMLRTEGTFALVLGDAPDGFVLARALGEQCEILTICVRPEVRQRGVGGQLLEALESESMNRHATKLFLDVAEDNIAAQHLYRAAGYTEIHRRKAYYSRSHVPGVDALVMSKSLLPLP